MATPAQLAEKLRKDRDSCPEPPRRKQPPPLPPRENSISAPPPYSPDDVRRSRLISEQWRSNDPRSSSTHSLVPESSDGRKTLLLVYIHGFMGNETSFQSFPAHVHNLLTITLAETHVVHTKIYPRYKSRKAIDFARDDFSNWLEPHENRHTDIVLLGHSMGGILSAEVVLKPPTPPYTSRPFQHQILGTINFDTPFLGMHPGVVVSGIGSLFRPAPEPPSLKQRQSSASGSNTSPVDEYGSVSSPSYATSLQTLSHVDSGSSSQMSLVQSITSPLVTPSPNDPFFNPPFPNDIRLPERKGWTNVLHFINKHSDGLAAATKQYFMSHIEFGGCLADYPGLKNRYEKIRSLEGVDDSRPTTEQGGRAPLRRVRFVNYYTASTGRPKAPNIPPAQLYKEGNPKPIEVEMQALAIIPSGTPSSIPKRGTSIEEHGNMVTTQPDGSSAPSAVEAQIHQPEEKVGEEVAVDEPPPMQHIDSMPIPYSEDEDDEEAFYDFPDHSNTATPISDPSTSHNTSLAPSITQQTTSSLTIVEMKLNSDITPTEPPLPPLPTPVPPFDPSIFPDKDTCKLATKDHARLLKAYSSAVKNRDAALKDRVKLREKREKAARKEREQIVKEEEKERIKEEKKALKLMATSGASTSAGAGDDAVDKVESAGSVREEKHKGKEKPKRDKKFCMLPPGTSGSVTDKCWIRIYMEGVDEVGAHCGLFFQGTQYEGLVGDVGDRIWGWVRERADR